jgi:lauroyl/myristoyl acyltransferase
MYYVYIISKFIAVFLPRRVVYFLGGLIAKIKFVLSKKDKAIVMNNLEPLVETKAQAEFLTKKIFINFIYYLVDFLRFSKLNKKFINKYVRFQGLDWLESLAEKKENIVIFSAHLGNYEL